MDINSILKCGEHEKAFRILVSELKDHKGAIEYCIANSKESPKVRKQLFQKLFAIYMDINKKYFYSSMVF